MPSSAPKSRGPSPPSSQSESSLEQPDRQRDLEQLGITADALSQLHEKYNQVTISLMNEDHFDKLVLESVNDRHKADVYDPEAIEAAVKNRTDKILRELDADFDKIRFELLRDIPNAIPTNKKEPEDTSMVFYLTQLLSRRLNLYDTRIFVTRGMKPLLQRIEKKGATKVKGRKNPSQHRPSRKQSPKGPKESQRRSPRIRDREKTLHNGIRGSVCDQRSDVQTSSSIVC